LNEKKYWISLIVFLFILILTAYFSIAGIAQRAENEYVHNLSRDIHFISDHIRTHLQEENHASIKNLIQGWGRLYSDRVSDIVLSDPGGNIIAGFQSDVQDGKMITQTMSIESGLKRATLLINGSLGSINKKIRMYIFYSGLLIAFITLFLFQLIRSILKNQRISSELEENNLRLMKFQTVIEQSPSSIVITDINGNIEYVNPEFTRLTGYSKKDAIGNNPRILKSSQLPEQLYEELWNTISAGKIWRGDLLNRKKSGELYWEDSVIGPVVDSDGNIQNYIAIKLDISNWKKINEELQMHKDQLEEIVLERTRDLENMAQEMSENQKALMYLSSIPRFPIDSTKDNLL